MSEAMRLGWRARSRRSALVQSGLVHRRSVRACGRWRRLILPQHPTEGILRERLAQLDHAPRYGHALLGFEQDANSVSARVTSAEGETAIRARYLLGADGGRSFMCKTLGVDFPGESLGPARWWPTSRSAA